MKLTVLIFGLFFISATVSAFQVEPMTQNFSATGRNAQQTYKVDNNSSVELAVEVIVYRRLINDVGEEELVEDDGNFLIMPPQTKIAPESIQSFRVRYLGSSAISLTESYRIVFKQLPLEELTKVSEIKLLFNFSTLAFVSPEKTSPIPDISIKDENTVEIENLGSKVMDLSQWKLKFKDVKKESVELGWERLKLLPISRFIMPMTSQQIDLSYLDTKINPSESMFIVKAR